MLNRINPVLIIAVVIFAVACSTAPNDAQSNQPEAEGSSTIELTWLGHATFVLDTGAGTKVVLDPMAEGMGYTVNPVQDVDLVTVSHEHGDHNNVEAAQGDPVILRGLTEDGWAEIDQTIGGDSRKNNSLFPR